MRATLPNASLMRGAGLDGRAGGQAGLGACEGDRPGGALGRVQRGAWHELDDPLRPGAGLRGDRLQRPGDLPVRCRRASRGSGWPGCPAPGRSSCPPPGRRRRSARARRCRCRTGRGRVSRPRSRWPSGRRCPPPRWASPTWRRSACRWSPRAQAAACPGRCRSAARRRSAGSRPRCAICRGRRSTRTPRRCRWRCCPSGSGRTTAAPRAPRGRARRRGSRTCRGRRSATSSSPAPCSTSAPGSWPRPRAGRTACRPCPGSAAWGCGSCSPAPRRRRGWRTTRARSRRSCRWSCPARTPC